MNIVHIIGNGFDLNLNLKTSYNHFYDYYLNVQNDLKSVGLLKKTITNQIEKWSDMELEFGKFTGKINAEEFDELMLDIRKNLSDYLIGQEDKMSSSKMDENMFFRYLAFPEENILAGDRQEITALKSKFSNQHLNVHIISLNYTRVIENLLENKLGPREIGRISSSSQIVFRGIEHLHGYVNSRMILGVNDKSQIHNTSFHENLDIIEALVKSDCNKSQRHLIDDKCLNLLDSASLICIFGSSIGETDRYIWEHIGNRLVSSESRLIIFTRGEKDMDDRDSHLNNRIERKIKNRFLSKTKLNAEQQKNVESKIIIGVNKNMFANLIKN